MTHDTSKLAEIDCVSAIPAEAATELGAEADSNEQLPEGAAIAALFIAAAAVIAALLGAHLLAICMP